MLFSRYFARQEILATPQGSSIGIELFHSYTSGSFFKRLTVPLCQKSKFEFCNFLQIYCVLKSINSALEKDLSFLLLSAKVLLKCYVMLFWPKFDPPPLP